MCLGEIAISLGRLILLLLIQNYVVCLGEIVISLGRLELLLFIQISLQYLCLCEFAILLDTWISCKLLRLTYSVSR